MSGQNISRLLVTASVLYANAVGFLIYLIVPHLIAATEFGKFSLAMALVASAISLFYEWARNALIRFSHVANLNQSARNRWALSRIYVGVTILVVVLGFGIGLVTYLNSNDVFGFSSPEIICIILCVITQALFDGRQALARASFNNRSFSIAWIFRSSANLSFAVLAAFIFRSSIFVIASFALSNFISFCIFNDRWSLLSTVRGEGNAEKGIRFFISYGLFIAFSSAIAGIYPVVLRYIPSQAIALGDVAGFMLSFDLASKVISVTGLTVNLLSLQPTIDAYERLGATAGSRRASGQLSMVFAAIYPIVLVSCLGGSTLQSLVIPAEYSESFKESIAWATIVAALISYRVYALESVFVVAKKARLSVFGPITTVVITLVAMYAVWIFLDKSTSNFCMAAALGALCGLVVSAHLAHVAIGLVVNFREFAKVVVAALPLAGFLLMSCIVGSSWLCLLLCVVGIVFYGLLLWYLNFAGVRKVRLLGS